MIEDRKSKLSSPKSPLSPSERATKWERMTEGLTGRAAEKTAYVLEDEVKYLREVMDQGESVGVLLRYVFPALRRAVPELTHDMEFSAIHARIVEGFNDCFTAPQHGCVINEPLSVEEFPPGFLGGLTERTQASLLRYHQATG